MIAFSVALAAAASFLVLAVRTHRRADRYRRQAAVQRRIIAGHQHTEAVLRARLCAARAQSNGDLTALAVSVDVLEPTRENR